MRRLTQQEVADMAGVSRGRVSQLENGLLPPRRYSWVAIEIARALDSPLEAVIADAGPPAPFARARLP